MRTGDISVRDREDDIQVERLKQGNLKMHAELRTIAAYGDQGGTSHG